MIRDILRGKLVRGGDKDVEQRHRANIQDVADFVTREEVLEYMLDFDPEAFFKTVKQMFTGKPLRYITEGKKFDFQRKGCVEAQKKRENILDNRHANRG